MELAQSVPVEYAAWHCGGAKYNNGAPAPFHGICMNYNSIGVEMCSRYKDGNFYIPDETMDRTARFVAELMKTYNIPVGKVIRHYDVTGKHCPEPWVRNPNEWERFKSRAFNYFYEMEEKENGKVRDQEKMGQEEKEVGESMTYYETLEQIPDGELRETIKDLVNLGIVKGTNKGLHLSEDMVRILVYLRRANVI